MTVLAKRRFIIEKIKEVNRSLIYAQGQEHTNLELFKRDFQNTLKLLRN